MNCPKFHRLSYKFMFQLLYNNPPCQYHNICLKVENALDIWKQHHNGAVGDRKALIKYLKGHQRANSCEDVILYLQTSSSAISGWLSKFVRQIVRLPLINLITNLKTKNILKMFQISPNNLLRKQQQIHLRLYCFLSMPTEML